MDIVDQIIEAYGGRDATLAALNLQHPQALHNWRSRGIPYKKIRKIHKDTGIPLDLLIEPPELGGEPA